MQGEPHPSRVRHFGPDGCAMLIEFHCGCGHRRPLGVEKLKASHRCEACKTTFRFAGESKSVESVVWLAVGGQKGPPRLAVPMPREIAVPLGSSARGFLSLPGEEISDVHAEVKIEVDGRLHVKHVAGDSGTWINRAKIITGVVGPNDRLRIGPYVMRILTTREVTEMSSEEESPEVVVEEETETPPPRPGRRGRAARSEPEEIAETAGAAEAEEDSPTGDEPDYREEGWTRGQRVRAGVSVLLIVLAAGYVAKTYFWPAVSAEMPEQTVFYCPADGTPVRGQWTSASGAPMCPQCGQRCVGELKYKAEPTNPPASAESTPGAEAASQPVSSSSDSKAAVEKPPRRKQRSTKKPVGGPDAAHGKGDE